jgi:hypothetical protein
MRGKYQNGYVCMYVFIYTHIDLCYSSYQSLMMEAQAVSETLHFYSDAADRLRRLHCRENFGFYWYLFLRLCLVLSVYPVDTHIQMLRNAVPARVTLQQPTWSNSHPTRPSSSCFLQVNKSNVTFPNSAFQ